MISILKKEPVENPRKACELAVKKKWDKSIDLSHEY